MNIKQSTKELISKTFFYLLLLSCALISILWIVGLPIALIAISLKLIA